MSTRLLLIALIALPLASCGKKADPALIGMWRGSAGSKSIYLTFEEGGKLRMSGEVAALGKLLPSFSLLTDFNLQPGLNTPITYKLLGENRVELEGDLTAMIEKLSAGGTGKADPETMKKLRPKDTVKYTVNGGELTLTNDQGHSVTLKKSE